MPSQLSHMFKRWCRDRANGSFPASYSLQPPSSVRSGQGESPSCTIRGCCLLLRRRKMTCFRLSVPLSFRLMVCGRQCRQMSASPLRRFTGVGTTQGLPSAVRAGGRGSSARSSSHTRGGRKTWPQRFGARWSSRGQPGPSGPRAAPWLACQRKNRSSAKWPPGTTIVCPTPSSSWSLQATQTKQVKEDTPSVISGSMNRGTLLCPTTSAQRPMSPFGPDASHRS
mmetsp:Transcript_8485/g.22226  ORF Transcript_8485/g.22226 Transcript_8485/m.22226 type:complete len:225 (+) Transcript_8485:432-1106(+)